MSAAVKAVCADISDWALMPMERLARTCVTPRVDKGTTVVELVSRNGCEGTDAEDSYR